MEKHRGRFAPSPNGPLHSESLVAAVGSYLEARTRGGEWLVRVEYLDPPRVVPGSADAILRTLEACSMTWDGAVCPQSTRNDAYHAALHELRQRARLSVRLHPARDRRFRRGRHRKPRLSRDLPP